MMSMKHGGLRRVLLVQFQRLEALDREHYNSLGGEALVEHGSENDVAKNELDDEL
jgi:hypothetical protein